MRPAPGVKLADGRYRLERRLGAGGMAAVWLAHDERLGRLVAVKVIADTLADDKQWLARFSREARAAAGLSHPNIVQVFDYGVESGRPYLVMEHVDGSSLAERLADPEAPPLNVRALAGELLAALAHVHAAGIIHRDIKPANVLLDAEGHAHVTDFGIAQPQDATSLTQTGMVIGTLRYLAPEVADGQPATVLSDLYSAGVLLREVAGETPPPWVTALLHALTAADPQQRPSDAAAALRLIDRSSPGCVELRGEASATEPTARLTSTDPRPRTTVTLAQAASGAVARGASIPWRLAAPATSWLRERGISPALALGGTLAVLAVILIVALSSGGDQPSRDALLGPKSTPAKPSAPLEEQLRALDTIIERAAER